jgi:hypothetical protein
MHGPSFRKWGEKATTEMGEDIDPVEVPPVRKQGRNTRRDAQHVHRGSIQPSCVEVYEVQGKVADYHNKAYIAVPQKATYIGTDRQKKRTGLRRRKPVPLKRV